MFLQNVVKIFPYIQIFKILFLFQSLKLWPFDICAFSIIVFLPDDIACLAYFKMNLVSCF